MEDWYSGLPGTRLKDNRVVSGRVFYNKDGLNVILALFFEKVFKAQQTQCLLVEIQI